LNFKESKNLREMLSGGVEKSRDNPHLGLAHYQVYHVDKIIVARNAYSNLG
jgi:hypothetical protein